MGKKHLRYGRSVVVGLFSLAHLCGCGGVDELIGGAAGDTLAMLGLGGRTTLKEDAENDTFAKATAVVLSGGLPHTISADIDSTSDIDVYEIGPAFAGDRITIDLSSPGRLDAAVAVFDADQNLIYLNDDRNFFAGLTDPYIQFVLPRDTKRCYVSVAASPTALSRGDYSLSISFSPTLRAPEPNPQTILLNFDGATGVSFGGRAAIDIPVFKAESISPELTGESDTLIDEILWRVREDYKGLDVQFYTSRDNLELGDGVATIHFGAYDPRLLGVAESIDEFNENAVQQAIVFIDTFQVFSALDPTIEEYAQAIANVTSHEAGHLLGLVHTQDVSGLMDITATLRQLTRNQAFTRSPIERLTFPMGYQDAAATLVDSVGGDLEAVDLNTIAQLGEQEQVNFELNAKTLPPARSTHLLSLCTSCASRKAKLAYRGG